METSKYHLIDSIISGLKNATHELEEFQLQLALGKAEASDKYEEVKKAFNTVIHEAKVKVIETASSVTDLKALFEELETQLSAGKAPDKETFNTQKQKIITLLASIESMLKISDLGADIYAKLSNEIEKFKIKMEILSLRFELGKMEFKQEFEEGKSEFAKRVDAIKNKFSEKESEIEKHLEGFGKELSDAYTHLKKAFSK